MAVFLLSAIIGFKEREKEGEPVMRRQEYQIAGVIYV